MSVNLQKDTAIKKLDLRKNTLEIILKDKKEQVATCARVAIVLDKSGSMRKLYKDGTIQNLLERIFPLALKFDDNGELDFWLFNDSFMLMPSVTLDNFFNYVETEIMTGLASKFWGQTLYAPVMNDVFNAYVEKEPSKLPSYIIFITDGNNTDKNNTKEVLTKASHNNLFWQYVGIGNEKFDFLKRLDNLKNRFIDNANFFETPDLNTVSDADLYKLLLNEYPQWCEEARVNNLI